MDDLLSILWAFDHGHRDLHPDECKLLAPFLFLPNVCEAYLKDWNDFDKLLHRRVVNKLPNETLNKDVEKSLRLIRQLPVAYLNGMKKNNEEMPEVLVAEVLKLARN